MLASTPWILWMTILAAPPPDRTIGPILGPRVFAVAHADLTRWDGLASLRPVAGPWPEEGQLAAIGQVADALKQAGTPDLYLVADLGDRSDLPVVAVPVGEGKDGAAFARVFAGREATFPAVATVGDVVIAGPAASVARIRGGQPGGRPDLLAALGQCGDAPIRLAISPGATWRRAVEETMTTLPAEVGGAPIEVLTRGVTWVAVAMTIDAPPRLRVVVQAEDDATAKAIGEAARRSLVPLAAMARADARAGDLADAIARITPETRGRQASVDLSPETTARLVAVPLRRAREAADRARSFDNLKNLGLALHNYHSSHNTFPPAFRAGADGKPLLSWRVLVLPYLEEQKLYDAFHLDEPWDSPHNKPLLARMPAVFASPGAAKAVTAEGKTTYLTLRGPATLFPGARGLRIQDVTDGTSNTIAVAEVSDAAAVAWTRPDDWEFGADEAKLPGLFGHYHGGTNFLFADGSARFLKETIATSVFRALATPAGGEVVDSEAF